ncbi:MAG TPA: serine hydrolase [Blastocatellia bacterium]|nr:serine hydrolase [Blastocatellia bacterium]
MQSQIADIAENAGTQAVAAAYYDYDTDTAWSFRGDSWFHAASTIKVAVLAALFAAVEEGRLALDARVHIRNRFLSAVDGEPYRVEARRDANSEVHAFMGKTLRTGELAHHMIVSSSNLATNLLVDLIGADWAQQALASLDIHGIELRRGVEDEKAYERGINNRITANGLIRLFRLMHEERLCSPDASRAMLDILHQQAFNSGIPAGLPGEIREHARIAHKTGEISTIAHDAGLVFLPRRQPYAIAILTEWASDRNGQQETVASISRAVYEHLIERT